jgi:hypothetical protein
VPTLSGKTFLTSSTHFAAGRWLFCLALLGCALATGCADGPFPGMASYNPWVTKDWQEDEKYATTYHTKVAQLGELRGRAPTLPPDEQQRLSTELAVELQREKAVVMRSEIVRTLSAFPTQQARAAIQLAATDPDPYVRRSACVALSQAPDADSLQILSQTLANDTDTDVKIVAARALGKFRDPEAAKALATLVDDNNPALQQTAMDSLRTVTGKDYGYSASAWRDYMQGGTPTPPPAPSIAQRLREDWWWW